MANRPSMARFLMCGEMIECGRFHEGSGLTEVFRLRRQNRRLAAVLADESTSGF